MPPGKQLQLDDHWELISRQITKCNFGLPWSYKGPERRSELLLRLFSSDAAACFQALHRCQNSC